MSFDSMSASVVEVNCVLFQKALTASSAVRAERQAMHALVASSLQVQYETGQTEAQSN